MSFHFGAQENEKRKIKLTIANKPATNHNLQHHQNQIASKKLLNILCFNMHLFLSLSLSLLFRFIRKIQIKSFNPISMNIRSLR